MLHFFSDTKKSLEKRGEYHHFPSKFFCLTVPKTSVRESFTVELISGIEKVWISGGGYHDFLSKIFCLTVPKFSVGESFNVAFFSGTKKSLEKGGGGTEYQDFPSKFFYLTVPKISVVESTVGLISGSEKVWRREGGGISRFSLKTFLSHSAEKFRRGILYCCINFGYRKSLEKRGEYHDFPSKIFCLTVPKFSVGESFNVAFFSGTKKSLEKRGGGDGVSRFSVEIFLSHSAENFRSGIYCWIRFR